MRNASCIGMAACLGGLAIGSSALAQDGGQVEWQLATGYPRSLAVIGESPFDLAETVGLISDGVVEIEVFEPGALVPVLETFDAVGRGAVDAGYTAGTFWSGRDITFNMFSAVPFGPATEEYLAWMYHGGGQELQDELYAENNLKSVLCGVVTPEAAGWFRKEIASIEDLGGLRMRFAGLGAQVVEKVGVSPQLMAPGDIYTALDRGTIDATEFSTPAADLSLGFHEVADYYYFPGWQQQSAFAQLLVNLDRWNELSDGQRALIETTCRSIITQTLAEGEAEQPKALAELRERGVEIRRLPDSIIDELQSAWISTVEELSAENENFAEVWDSYASFRESYEQWRELGYLR